MVRKLFQLNTSKNELTLLEGSKRQFPTKHFYAEMKPFITSTDTITYMSAKNSMKCSVTIFPRFQIMYIRLKWTHREP